MIFLSFSYGEFCGVFFLRRIQVINRNVSDCAELCSEMRGLLLLFWFVS